MTIDPRMLPAYVIPGADFPPWATAVFGLIGVAVLVLVILQTVRYFRNDRHD